MTVDDGNEASNRASIARPSFFLNSGQTPKACQRPSAVTVDQLSGATSRAWAFQVAHQPRWLARSTPEPDPVPDPLEAVAAFA
jgi:hypothetical protein